MYRLRPSVPTSSDRPNSAVNASVPVLYPDAIEQT
jgi:hypothetical protein